MDSDDTITAIQANIGNAEERIQKCLRWLKEVRERQAALDEELYGRVTMIVASEEAKAR